MAWVKVAWVSDRGGHVGIEHFGATMNGLLSEIKTGKVREKIRQKMKQANRTSYRDVLYGQKQTTPRFMWIHLIIGSPDKHEHEDPDCDDWYKR